MKYTVLITGVAGLIGSRLAQYLIDTYDVTVVGIDDLSCGFVENVPQHPNLIFYAINAGDTKTVNQLFEKYNFDYVYHLAAYAAECVSPFIRCFNYTNNVVVTANIVNHCIKYKVKRLVFTSSLAVYGANVPPFNEDLPRQPVDPYGVAKSACEQDIEIANKQHGLDYCIIRPHNVYGVNQNLWDSYRNVLGIWMYKVLINDPITIFGDGSQVRAFTYIDDILEPLWKAATTPAASKQIINLGGTQEITIKEAAQTLESVVREYRASLTSENIVSNIIYLPPRHEVKYAFPTYQKSIDILGYSHKTSLYDGLKVMWAWAQKQPKRPRFIWTEYELEEGLYPYWTPQALQDGYWKEKTNDN